MRAAFWLTVVRIALWLAPFRRVWKWFGVSRPTPARVPENQAPIARTRWAVDLAARRMPGATCLVRALTLRHLLQQQGVASQVRIGVARSETPTLRAHAWVEVEGVAITDIDSLADYRAFPDLDRTH
jgi:hypothetical protein